MAKVAANIVETIAKFKMEQEKIRDLPVRLEWLNSPSAAATLDLRFEVGPPQPTDQAFVQDGVRFLMAPDVASELEGKCVVYQDGELIAVEETATPAP